MRKFRVSRKGFTPVILIAVLALIIAVGGVGIGLAWKTSYLDKWLPLNVKGMFGRGEKPEEEPGEEPEEEPEPAKASELKSLDGTWNLYTNYQLGFSIKVPKKVALFYTSQGDELFLVKIFEDTDNNAVFIDTEYFYSIKGQKKLNSLEWLKTEYAEGGAGGESWKIVVDEGVASDAELDTFIKEHYGSKCGLGKKKATGQKGVYDVEIKAEDGGLSAGVAPECFINVWYVIKYSPIRGKVARWFIGNMGAIFVSSVQSPGTAIEYDNEMIESFRFLE